MIRERRWSLWVCFAFLVLSNSALSYSNLPPVLRGWIFLAGVLVPFLSLLLASSDKQGGTEKIFVLGTFDLGKWETPVVAILVSAAVLLRFFRLTDFHFWPTGDEALNGFLSADLCRRWSWKFFYMVGELPPLLIWILSLFFRFFGSPFLDLWFPPALFSLMTFFAGLWVSRWMRLGSVSFVFSFLLAISYWPLESGRFCHQGVLVPFWELSSIGLLAVVLQRTSFFSAYYGPLVLGLWVGLGSFTFASWPVVLLGISVVLGLSAIHHEQLGWNVLKGYYLGLFLGLLPFLWAVFHEGYGHHLIDSSFESHWFSLQHQWITHLSYITCFFWGSLQVGTSYGPSWGGMLNPILTSGFFVGLAYLLRNWRNRWSAWILFGFLICLLPAFLISDYVELNRVIQVMPFLLFIAALGIQQLLSETDGRLRRVLLIALLSVSCALDWFHLIKPSLQQPYWKLQFQQTYSDENAQAYRLFDEAASLEGPGLVFADFLLLSHNHSLDATTFHFNAALNPELDPKKAKWAGVMVNEHYAAYLAKRFPKSQWFPVSPSLPDDGNMVAGIIPVTDGDKAALQKWVQVHLYFHQLNVQAEGILNSEQKYQEALQHLPEGYAQVQGDPFLESCFGEWLAQYHYGPTYDINIGVLKRAIQKGYPTANLYYKLGNFYWLDHQMKEAQKAYQQAMRCKLNHTQAAQALAYLKAQPQATATP